MRQRSKRTKGIALFGAFFIAVSVSFAQSTVVSANPCDGNNFYRPTLNDGDPFSPEIEAAVLRLVVTGPRGSTSEDKVIENGTGYLIDKNNGYVLTAAHVVSHAFDRPPARIRATSPNLSLELSAFKTDESNDIAILKVGPADLPTLVHADVQALDIALHFRSPGFKYYTIGYPNGEAIPTAQKVQLQGGSGAHLLKVGQHVEQGSSGSPLIDDEGAVVATLVNDKFMDTAEYRALVDARDLLDQIRMDSEVQSLNERLLDAKQPPDSKLVQRFRWTSGNPSNLNLYEWIRHATGNVAGKLREFLTCPILPAYSDRLLVDAIPDRIVAAAPGSIRAQLLLEEGNQAILLNRPDVALTNANLAATLFETEQDKTGEARAFMAIGVANLYLHRFDDASNNLWWSSKLPTSPSEEARTQVYLAQAYAGRGDAGSASKYVYDALPALERHQDHDGKALAFVTLGEVAENQGDYKTALARFDESRELFSQTGNTVGETEARTEANRARELESGQSWARRAAIFMRENATWAFAILSLVAAALLAGWLVPKNFGRK